MEMGERPLEAALNGAREIGFTIISMTLSLAAVFIPVLFMGGIVGRLLHEFAVTIGVAILVSGFVSLSLTPMLGSRFLRPPHAHRHGRLYMALEKMFDRMVQLYDETLQSVLRHGVATMAVSLVILILTAYLFVVIPKGFLPPEDAGLLFGFTEAAQGISYDDMVRHQRQVAEIIMQQPYVEVLSWSVGPRGITSTGNTGTVFMHLKPRRERPSAEEIIQDLRPKVARVPGISVYLQNLPPIRIGGQLTKSQYQFTLQSPDTQELYEYAPKLEAKLREFPQLQDVTSDLQIKNPQVNVQIDRDRAAALGVTAEQVEDALYTAYSARQISTIYAPNNAYKVIMELEPQFQADPGALSMLYVRSRGGQLVPLSAVSRLRRSLGPLTVNHLGQLPAVTISFNLRPGVALGDAVTLVDRAARQVLPATVSTSFQGAAQAFESSLRGLGVLLIMAVLVIYIVLGILYESFIHPLTILSGLPSAGFGALLTLLFFRWLGLTFDIAQLKSIELNLYAFVGIIMLIGIVKKNAIMMIDFALDAQRKAGKSAEDSIYHGCLVRFRPIMMTTMAALMGTLPIALGFGAGSESRRPLGLAVVGGLLFSQLLTLYITPVVYIYLDRFQHWLRRGQAGVTEEKISEVALVGGKG